tara:strand:- start:511 stop:1584 length:1074 start_codon:yes stop_codon:yes gene_type:complete
MAYTTIDDPSVYFQTALWTGDNGNLSVTNDGNSDLKPDWIWAKRRDGTGNHVLADSTRGGDAHLRSNITDAESQFGGLDFTFATDGFTSSGSTLNESSRTHVAWQWKANGGTTTTNDASSTGVGTIDSVYQANTTAGFSIVTYTGTGSDCTIAHGLGSVPQWIIVKCRNEATTSWRIYHVSNGNTNALKLDSQNAAFSATENWNSTTPTSTVFSLGTNENVNGSADTFVAYCFAEKQGYSKFGSYIANNSTDGPFVYLGFKPAWIMIKNTSAASDFPIADTKREVGNPFAQEILFANVSDAETSYANGVDFLSNGFKVRSTGSNGVFNANNTSHKFIYMAFAESPFVSSKGVPCTAR